eukprot:TRINITY_DN33_c0_g1_i1.p1 TRINITY_DN33_c0_g1~~TRINITY_DN33_c0_g1_i1.p1  ORF type:complete len:336 (-),score=76.32 TRINITY_DN33_c0_g1_i1:51-1058(-)
MLKLILVLSVFVILGSFAISIEQTGLSRTSHFDHFVEKFGKVYSSQQEYEQRKQNFEASLKRIEEKNKKSPSARYGITKFSDMTPAEFKSKILMKNGIPAQKVVQPTDILAPKPNLAIPDFLDWRTHGAVTPVKNQEQCGSCWAFSVTENIESMWILAGKATANNLNLSPQQIVDCDESDMGCNGGNPPTAYDYVISAGGLDTLASYPYTAQDGNCAFKSSDVGAKISSWKYATSWYSETTLQQNLISWGPLSVCVDASNWQDYQSGVMTWTECAWVNVLDHCVQLVGYNSTSSSSPYWIVRNSWGTDWGVNGYIYLQMWSDTCGIAHEATSAVV